MMYNKVLPEFNLNLLNMNKRRAHLADITHKQEFYKIYVPKRVHVAAFQVFSLSKKQINLGVLFELVRCFSVGSLICS